MTFASVKRRRFWNVDAPDLTVQIALFGGAGIPPDEFTLEVPKDRTAYLRLLGRTGTRQNVLICATAASTFFPPIASAQETLRKRRHQTLKN